MSSSESTCIWSCCQPITHLHLHPEIFTALSCLHSCLCIPDLGMKMRGMMKIKNKAITVISIMLPILGMKILMDSKTVLNNIPKTLMNLNLKVKMLLKMDEKGLIVTDPRNARSVEQSIVPKRETLFPRMRMKTSTTLKIQMKMIVNRPLRGSIDG